MNRKQRPSRESSATPQPPRSCRTGHGRLGRRGDSEGVIACAAADVIWAWDGHRDQRDISCAAATRRRRSCDSGSLNANVGAVASQLGRTHWQARALPVDCWRLAGPGHEAFPVIVTQARAGATRGVAAAHLHGDPRKNDVGNSNVAQSVPVSRLRKSVSITSDVRHQGWPRRRAGPRASRLGPKL